MNRRAFSLIEVLVAIALSAGLSVAVLGVVAGLGRDMRAGGVGSMQRDAWSSRLVETVTQDVIAARWIKWSDSTGSSDIRMNGYSGVNPQDLSPCFRPVEVIYRITQHGSVSCLVRQQQWLDDPSVPSPWSQVLACGVKSMELIPLDMISSGDASAEATGRSSPMHGSTGRAGKELMLRTGNPRLILLRVIWSEGNQPALERTLVVR